MAGELVQYGDFVLNADYPNLVGNGDFVDWTEVYVPDSFNASFIDYPNGDISEVGPGNFHGGAGDDACNIYEVAGPGNLAILSTESQGSGWLAIGTGYIIDFDLWRGSGSITLYDGDGDTAIRTISSTGHYTNLHTPDDNNHLKWQNTTSDNALNITIDNLFVRIQTPWILAQDWNLTSNSNAVWTSSADDAQALLNQVIPLVEGTVYKVEFTIASLSLNDATNAYLNVTLNDTDGSGAGLRIFANGTYRRYIIAGSGSLGIAFRVMNDDSGDTFTLSNVSVNSGTENVTARLWFLAGAGVVDYLGANQGTGPNGAWEILCCHNGHNYFKTISDQHPDGAGGTSYWYIYWDGIDSWVMSTTLGGATGASYWKRTDPDEIGTYTPQGDAGPTTPTGDFEFSEARVGGLRYRYRAMYRWLRSRFR